MPQKKLLELSTLLPDRLFVTIDSVDYELKAKEEFGFENLAQLQALLNQVQFVQNAASITAEEARDLSDAMDKFLRLILIDCPDEIHKRLRDAQRLEIFNVFQQAIGAQDTQKPNRKTRRVLAK